jgi:hypothetical protein
MLFEKTTFIGIDTTSGRAEFTYAALDGDLNLLALSGGEADDVLAFLGGQESAFVAVNAPSSTNKGVVKKMTGLPRLHVGRGVEMRLAEHELRQHGIAVSATPARVDLCAAWVQMGFAFYRKLKGLGYKPYPSDQATHQWLETHPQAIFATLIGQPCLPKPTLEGRLQRQLILFDHGVGLKDPMDFFEELTRHKLLKGSLPTEMIYTPGQLDALAAAYTAFCAATRSKSVTILGEPNEGQVVLPVKELKTRY